MVHARLTLGQRWPGYVGPPERRLFACHHLPQVSPERELGVVLCYPLGQEYMRSHRAYLHLASRLAAVGFHVGRFEYYGTGDSPGDEDGATVGDWLGDVSVAVDEARRAIHRRHVALAGLRFGAALTMLAAANRGDVSHLVLWDPIVRGQDYLDQLKVQHQERIWRNFFDERTAVEPLSDRPKELLGFKMNERLLDELAVLDLLAVQTKPARSALVFDTHDDPAVQQLRDHLQNLGVQVTYQHIPGIGIWTEDTDKGLVPTQALESIVSWLSEHGQ